MNYFAANRECLQGIRASFKDEKQCAVRVVHMRWRAGLRSAQPAFIVPCDGFGKVGPRHLNSGTDLIDKGARE